MQFLKAWDSAAATSSESPGATQRPDARTVAERQLKIIKAKYNTKQKGGWDSSATQ